jgi:hypothetical protein
VLARLWLVRRAVEPVLQQSAYEEPCVYERFPGAATASLAPAYRPRQPQASVLHRVVRENLLTFLEQGIEHSASGEGYPPYVENELRRYIACGATALGFARVKCKACGYERLLPFSCKNRGVCPSCTARRMSEEAAYLVDMVLPKSRYRQWTFTFPWPIRRLMARDYTLITAILNLVIRALYAYQRRMARRAGHRGAPGSNCCASVTFVQRFGGALNSNVHLHVLAPDAVFMPGETEDDVLRIVPLPVPEDKHIFGILEKVVRRVSKLVHKRCGLDDDLGLEPETDVLDGAIDEAMRNVPRVPDIAEDEQLSDEALERSPQACRTGKRAMRLEGFSLHANTAVAADNRLGLEKLCSYGMRPPFALERLSLEGDGRVRLELKRPWPTADGASALIFEPVEFIRRLAALIPPPFAHLVRYHGLFAPRARARDLLPAAPVTDIRLEAWARAGLIEPPDSSTGSTADTRDENQAQDSATTEPAATPGAQTSAGAAPTSFSRDVEPSRPKGSTTSSSSWTPHAAASGAAASKASPPVQTFVLTGQRKRLRWRDLLRRVFAVDALLCPRCLGPMTVIAYITEVAVVQKILMHLGLPTEPPALCPARGPAQLELWPGAQAPPIRSGHTLSDAGWSRAPPGAGPELAAEPEDFMEPDFDWGA